MVVASRELTELENPLRLWTVEDYHRMVEVGILQPEEKVELIAGQILRKMSPQKTPHSTAITRTERVLRKGLGERILLRIQAPIYLNEYSEPEPDIAVVYPDSMDYIAHHPYPEDIFLLVEIADKTIKRDCNLKAKAYAKDSIKDYWVLDVKKRQIHLFREPAESGYLSHVILSENEQVSPLEFPDLQILIRDILPPIIV
jgi:Uma2 family endonuclease